MQVGGVINYHPKEQQHGDLKYSSIGSFAVEIYNYLN